MSGSLILSHVVQQHRMPPFARTGNMAMLDIEVLLDTYAHQYSAQAHRLEIVSKQIEATEDLLNLRLESIQKNTFVANALFHMILTFLGIPTVMPYPKPHSQAEPASTPRARSFVSAASPHVLSPYSSSPPDLISPDFA